MKQVKFRLSPGALAVLDDYADLHHLSRNEALEAILLASVASPAIAPAAPRGNALKRWHQYVAIEGLKWTEANYGPAFLVERRGVLFRIVTGSFEDYCFSQAQYDRTLQLNDPETLAHLREAYDTACRETAAYLDGTPGKWMEGL